MKTILYLLAFLAAVPAFGQNWEWGNFFASQLYRQGEIAVDDQGNLYSFVTWNNQMACFQDPDEQCPNLYFPEFALLLVQSDPTGKILQAKVWNEPDNFFEYFAQGLRFDASGNLYILVETRDKFTYNLDHEVWRLDTDWNTVAQVNIQTNNGVFAQFDVDDAGNVYIAHATDGNLNMDQLRVAKYDASLVEVWSVFLQGVNSDPRPKDLALGDNGLLCLLGKTDGTVSFSNNPLQITGFQAAFVALLDAATGLPTAAKAMSVFPASNEPTCLEALPGGQYLIGGTYVDSGQLFDVPLASVLPGWPDSYLAFLDPDLNLSSYTLLQGGVQLERAVQDAQGNLFATGKNEVDALALVFAGDTVALAPTPRSIFAAKFSPDLHYQWSSFYGSTGDVNSDNAGYRESGYGLALSGPGHVYLTGLSKARHFVVEGDTIFDYGSGLFIARISDDGLRATGQAWFDLDGDGMHGPGELPYPFKGLLDEDGSLTCFTNSAGRFSRPLLEGAHALALAKVPQHFTVQPPVQAYTVVQPLAQGVDGLDFRLVPDLLIDDLSLDATAAGPARPGFLVSYVCTLRNEGTLPLSGSLKIKPDNHLYFYDAVPFPSAAADTLVWDFAGLLPGDERVVALRLYVDAATPLGTPLVSSAWTDLPAGDPSPANNADTVAQVAQGAFDPNDKQVWPQGPINLATQPELLEAPFEYLIRFQNTGTDLAFNIVVEDTISDLLDLGSFSLTGTSHDLEVALREGNVLAFHFDRIFLPDSLSDEPNSHGFVKYRIMPKPGLLPGQVVRNTAHIYFDFNAPVATNTVETPLTFVTPSGSFVEHHDVVCGQPLSVGGLGYPIWNPASIVQGPLHGTADILHGTGPDTLVYWANAGFEGTDTVVVACAFATQIVCDTGTYILHVSCPPLPDSTEFHALHCDSILLLTQLGLPGTASPSVVQSPWHGELALLNAEASDYDSLLYIPESGFMGADSFLVDCAYANDSACTTVLFRLQVSCTDLVRSVAGEDGFRLFPNPSTGSVNLESDWPVLALRLTNAMGACVWRDASEPAFYGKTVDWGELPKGWYCLSAFGENGRMACRAVVLLP